MMMSTCDSSGKPKSNSSYRKLKGSSSLWSIYMNFVLHLTLLVLTLVTSAPLRHPTTIAEHYLLKFGYLPLSENGPGEIRDRVSEAAVSDAILRLQRFGHLKETGVVDAATLRLMNKPRCGVPDEPNGQFRGRQKRFAIQGQKWETKSLTWSLKTLTGRMEEQDIREDLKAALDVWTKHTGLSFSERKSNANADIQIEFSRGNHGDGYSFDGKGLVLAHAFFPGQNQGGDAHFDDDEEWISSRDSAGSRGTVLFSVAAHEFGHSLGLSHSDVQGALMYPWYQTFTRDKDLHPDDVNGIQQLYGYKEGMAYSPYAPKLQPQGPGAPRYRPRRPHSETPSGCDSNYDAISLIRGELFIFKGKYYWRFNEKGMADRVPPAHITAMWDKLPKDLSHVDAVYERNGRDIIFFIGKNYWVFNGTNLLYTRPLTELGFKSDVEKIDGALVWGHNGKTYLFSGKQYWRLDDTQEYKFKVEPDYPRDLYVWKGVPYDIDSVFRYKDHKTYFFKGKVFWTFDDKRMKVESETPAFSGPFWMGCTSGALAPSNPPLDSPNTSTAFSISPNPLFTLAMMIYVFFL